MEDHVKARIFDPFFTTKFTGRGLGLAAASGFVRAHGGGIQLVTAPGQGSRFRVLLPVTQRPSQSGSHSGGRRAILPLEDSARLRSGTSEGRERRAR